MLELCGSERLCARGVREREQREGKEGVKAWMISSSLLRPSVCAEETRPEGEKERGFHKDVFLGKGTYGAVWRVTKKDTGKVYAMKTVDMRNKKQSEKCVVWWMGGVCCVCVMFTCVLAGWIGKQQRGCCERNPDSRLGATPQHHPLPRVLY